MKEEIVSAEWLKNNLNNSDIVILDSSPKHTVSAKSSLQDKLCIPNSRIFNIKGSFTDLSSKYPNTFPSSSYFEKQCRNLGINTTSEIIVYDNLGIYTSPRVWWLFKVMGHEKIQVLNGGLPEWERLKYETTNRNLLNQEYGIGNFKSNFHVEYLVNHDEVVDNIDTKNFLLVDARSKGRFNGTEEEPRNHLMSGHIEGSVNIPYTDVLEDGKFRSKSELSKLFSKQIVHRNKLVFSCGSGMTACIVLLASEMAFKNSKYLYDGSWTEYAESNNLIKNQ